MNTEVFASEVARGVVGWLLEAAIRAEVERQFEVHIDPDTGRFLFPRHDARVMGMAAALTAIVNGHRNDPRELWSDKELAAFHTLGGDHAMALYDALEQAA